MPNPLDVPILFCIFNRPEATGRVFQAIARQRPRRLLIAGDGPRPLHPDDVPQVDRCRQIVSRIDWNCEVSTLFSEQNLGCRQQMARAITWGFAQQERLIILEDDCLPHPDFFTFCAVLLEHYADRPEVMTICGIGNPQLPTPNDYRFSKYPLIWGWASWRRAWQHYDLEMKAWDRPGVAARVLNEFTESTRERAYWEKIFQAQAAQQIDTWDYSWTFACWLHRGLTICPRTNLVSNIGFGQQATHTRDANSPFANQPTFPLTITHHPPQMDRDLEWDRAAREFYFSPPEPRPSLKRRSAFSFQRLQRWLKRNQS
jgi:hypothetical protein